LPYLGRYNGIPHYNDGAFIHEYQLFILYEHTITSMLLMYGFKSITDQDKGSGNKFIVPSLYILKQVSIYFIPFLVTQTYIHFVFSSLQIAIPRLRSRYHCTNTWSRRVTL